MFKIHEVGRLSVAGAFRCLVLEALASLAAHQGRSYAWAAAWLLVVELSLYRFTAALPSTKVHKAMLDLLKALAKQLTPEVLAGYLGTMLEATKDTRTRLQDPPPRPNMTDITSPPPQNNHRCIQ